MAEKYVVNNKLEKVIYTKNTIVLSLKYILKIQSIKYYFQKHLKKYNV